jgi:hypothetical protein
MSRKFGLLFFSLLAVSPSAEAQTQDFGKLAGTWLITPQHYDEWADKGVEIAAYPVLHISAEGRFTLYRLQVTCAPDGPDGKPYPSDSAERDAACTAARERSGKHGFRTGYARVSAAGVIKREGDRMRFVSDEVSPVPHEWAMVHRMLRERGFFNEAAAKAYETFHSTFYVLDGREVTVVLNGGALKLNDAQSGRSVEYRATRPEVLDAAIAVPAAFSVDLPPYFRCLTEKLEAAMQGPGAPTNDLASGASLAREHLLLFDELRSVSARKDPDTRERATQLQAKIEENREKVAKHPLFEAIREKKLGAFLGCPEKDDQ